MNYRQALLAITLATGLGGCATSPDYGLNYQDGSYYSPAGEGRGDYYVGAEPHSSYYYYDDFDGFFGSGYGWYGSPFYNYSGYCPARYRYCSGWGWGDGYGGRYPQTGFQIYFGSPWDPYWGRDYYPRQRHHGQRPPPPGGTNANGDIRTPPPQWTPGPRQAEGRRPRPRPEPMSEDRPDDGDAFPAPTSGNARRSPFPRRQDAMPARSPRPKPPADDGN